MKNGHTNTIFYCNWKTIKKYMYVSAKIQPKPICPSLQVATESAAEEKKKKKKKSRQGHRGSRQRTGCPNKSTLAVQNETSHTITPATQVRRQSLHCLCLLPTGCA